MIETRKIERGGRGAEHAAKTTGGIPIWVRGLFRSFYGYAKKWAPEFNKHLVKDREEEFIKEASKPFKDI